MARGEEVSVVRPSPEGVKAVVLEPLKEEQPSSVVQPSLKLDVRTRGQSFGVS